MTNGEFDVLMNIVYSRWGAKSYPDMVKRRIWYFWSKLPQKSFENAIYILLDTARVAPMPNEFKMLAYAEKDRLGIKQGKDAETKPSTEAKCFDCGDAGNLFVRHKEKKTSGVFRCHCSAGRARPNGQGCLWSDAYSAHYDKEPIYQKGLGDWRPKPDQSIMEMVNALRRAPFKKSEKRIGELANPFRNDEPEGAA